MTHDFSIAELDGHPGANGVPIALGSLQLQPYPMIRRLGFVVQENGRLAAIVERQIHVPIIIVIATRHASADVPLLKIGAGDFGNMLKTSPAVVEKKLGLLAKPIVRIAVLIDVARNMAIGHYYVQAAVAIKVEEAGAKAELPPTRRPQTGAMRDIQKLTLAFLPALVSKEGVRLASKSGGKQIRQAVAVQIERDHAEGLGVGLVDAGFLADIGEGEIAVVSVKEAASALKSGRRTGIPLASFIRATGVIL